MGRTYLALGDPNGARAVLRQAQDIFEQSPDLGVLPQQAAELRAKLSTTTAGTRRGLLAHDRRATTPALLSTHLALKEISERLFVSRNRRENPGDLGVPQVRGLLASRRHHPHARTRPALSLLTGLRSHRSG